MTYGIIDRLHFTKRHIVLHFGYHKCMTVYFINVFKSLSNDLKWFFKEYRYDDVGFIRDAWNVKNNRILTLIGKPVDFTSLPKGYRATHIIRDPRDLLVSGYHYHKWCEEKWVNKVISEENVQYMRLKELGLERMARGLTYKELLNALDINTGLIVELNWRQLHFQYLKEWDYNNPYVMELRYEEVFGNELQVFMKIFEHYRFPRRITSKGLKYVEQYSFNYQREMGLTGSGKHLAKGEIRQWSKELPEDIKNVFKDRYQDLLVHLGYEQDDQWC